jgi:hypothetical protein
MRTFLATVSVLALSACSSSAPGVPPTIKGPSSVAEEGYRGIEKATLLAKGME